MGTVGGYVGTISGPDVPAAVVVSFSNFADLPYFLSTVDSQDIFGIF